MGQRTGNFEYAIEMYLQGLNPGSRLHYFELLRHYRYEDFEWKSVCPEQEYDFAWLGRGFLAQELHNEGEDNWYDNIHHQRGFCALEANIP